MKSRIISYIILSAIVLSVGANSIFLHKSTSMLIEAVAACDINEMDSKEKYSEIYKEYKKQERFITLTVNHGNLTSTEEAFCELLGALENGDTATAAISKKRLIGSLDNLRRLSGINFESII